MPSSTFQRYVAVALFCAMLIAAAFARAPFVAAADCLDSDAAVTVLMARHFAQGEFSPYTWGHKYMGSLEATLLTPLAAFGQASATTASLLAIAIMLGQVVASAALASRAGVSPWLVAVAWLIPAAGVAPHQTNLYGARGPATLLMLIAFLLTQSQGRYRWLGAGALTGIAFFGDHVMVIWALPLAWLAWREKGAIRQLVAGATPFVLSDVVLSFWADGDMAGPQPPGRWLVNLALLPRSFAMMLGEDSPYRTVPLTDTWWLLSSGLQLALLVAAIVMLVRSRLPPLVGAIALSLPLAAIFFLVAGRGLFSFRYLLPVFPAISILLALAVSRFPARLRPLVFLFPIPALLSYGDELPVRGAQAGAACRAQAVAIGNAIDETGIRGLWADYWEAYRLALLLDERIPVACITSSQLSFWCPTGDPRPDWRVAVNAARPVGYWFTGNSNPAKIGDVTPIARIQIEGGVLLVVPETVPGSKLE